MADSYTTREIAELFHQPTWHIQRLYENGDLPEPTRFAGKRVIRAGQIPAIVDALRGRGWLPGPKEAPHAS